ncbi:MAG TPA: hypothetical protein VK983_00775 [Candidatus Limnocylindrales bacterium]|nr:hypothetical protein [Candidatus Limnocylindrales bacterium]
MTHEHNAFGQESRALPAEPGAQRVETVRSLVDLIKKTEVLARHFPTYTTLTLGGETLGSRQQTTHNSGMAVRLGHEAINRQLHELQGINHFYDTPAGERVECTLISWHGPDPDQNGFHRWGIAQAPGQILSLDAAALDEIKDNL